MAKTMKVKVTKKMVSELNKVAENMTFHFLEIPVNNYPGDVWHNEDDFDFAKGVMKIIQVTYPADYYAMPNYLTTNDLRDIMRPKDTVNSYINRVVEYMTI